jgi:hypothetical protein
VKKSNTVKFTKGLLYLILALFLVGSIINCGGGSSSGPVQVQAPKAFIAAAIKRTIEEKKAAGELENLQSATFDFSNLQIAVVGEKEDYVDDQPTKLVKVSVSGSYMIKQESSTKTIQADETIIFATVGNTWKVTEKVNPWS